MVVLRGTPGTPKCGVNVDPPNKYREQTYLLREFHNCSLYQLPTTVWHLTHLHREYHRCFIHRSICFEPLTSSQSLVYLSMARALDLPISAWWKLSCLYLAKYLNIGEFALHGATFTTHSTLDIPRTAPPTIFCGSGTKTDKLRHTTQEGREERYFQLAGGG